MGMGMPGMGGSFAENPFFKTKLCNAWMSMGSCARGPRCLYAHGPTELRTRPHMAAFMQMRPQMAAFMQAPMIPGMRPMPGMRPPFGGMAGLLARGPGALLQL